MKTTKNIYQQVTDAIVKQLESGIIPWQKPWQNELGMGCISHANGKPYSMINQMLLGGRCGEWLTYAQVQAEGGRIKRGETASMVVFWQRKNIVKTTPVYNEEGEQIGEADEIVGTMPILKEYHVFHIDQCEGIKAKYEQGKIEREHETIESADEVAMNYAKREELTLLIKQSSKAYYSPSADMVVVPEQKQYKCIEEYYSTLYHELVHSTGHANRLNRDGIVDMHFFGDETYSREELVAEMGAAFMLNILGIETEKAMKNSAAYIQSWLRALKNDNKMIIAAASKAEKAVKYIMNGEK